MPTFGIEHNINIRPHRIVMLAEHGTAANIFRVVGDVKSFFLTLIDSFKTFNQLFTKERTVCLICIKDPDVTKIGADSITICM